MQIIIIILKKLQNEISFPEVGVFKLGQHPVTNDRKMINSGVMATKPVTKLSE